LKKEWKYGRVNQKLGVGNWKFQEVVESKSKFLTVLELMLQKMQKPTVRASKSSGDITSKRSKADLKEIGPKVSSRPEKVESIEDRYTLLIEKVKILEKKVICI
jgi:hypothetical protein